MRGGASCGGQFTSLSLTTSPVPAASHACHPRGHVAIELALETVIFTDYLDPQADESPTDCIQWFAPKLCETHVLNIDNN